jgi:hypothetical protein
VTTPANPPGDRRPARDRAPSDRYRVSVQDDPSGATQGGTIDQLLLPTGLVLGTAVAFVILGGFLTVTAGLVIVAAFSGWLAGRLVSPPGRAAAVGFGAVALGLLGIWLYGRIEGGVLDPIAYLVAVEGPVVVIACLLAASGLAAAASQ